MTVVHHGHDVMGADPVHHRRGGPRIRKKTASNSPPRASLNAHPQEADSLLLPDASQQPVDVQNYVDPGAGLGQLPDMPQDSDFIFDSLFPTAFSTGVFDGVSVPQGILPVPATSGPLVRTYRSDRTLLQAYYCWIHPYVPILPPPETSPPVDEPIPLSQNEPPLEEAFEPSTPIALALSAVLALIPCAEDTNPSGPDSVLFRRKCAQFFAQSAIESIEAESEIPHSATEPHKALESSPPPADHRPFHPRVPVELESIIALDLLSIYEYAQRGNIKKMRTRAGQALMEAMTSFSLHTQTDDSDFFAEAKRRVWWMTYVCATQSSIVSNTPPPLELYNASFTTKYPTLDVDPEAWPVFIESQQAILAATQFVIQMNKALATQGDMEPIYKKMTDLESRIAPMVERSESWAFSGCLAPVVEPAETCLIRTLRSMARIKINSARVKVHRYCAFYDVPIFSGKHCDLKSTSEVAPDGYEPLPWPLCCTPLSSLHSASNSLPHSHSTTNSTKTSGSPESLSYVSSLGSPPQTGTASPPTTNHQQQLEAAIMVATMSDVDMAGNHAGGAHDSGTTSSVNNGNGNSNGSNTRVPFSSHYSAKICLRSALNIARGFDGLPYPNPSGQYGLELGFLSPTSPIVAPRMLPSFVCCAMQGAYVFLSIYRKTKVLQPSTSSNGYLVSMLVQLQRGLTSILAALENYATAFEALRSMRDQIRLSAESLMLLEEPVP
ncbi:Fungal Zn binuclear cluster domain containing protein [Sporothrix schenckii 1099-18]|uniref:Fungal Zn binuclear cluster domain containing protein n=1 Tax=Sporothrix schenckii 1099-18 TaxID=1397361 RepID=A0A0F2MHL7_SPOSC|nr:Fungal Zn binuclear cluster domain containing protein [Sporothrix schenckii 1099-18]KJR88355.1 Fungal Zn binuclear cluster domain containing protein [Sporothrix schenckii 1099-18]